MSGFGIEYINGNHGNIKLDALQQGKLVPPNKIESFHQLFTVVYSLVAIGSMFGMLKKIGDALAEGLLYFYSRLILFVGKP